MVVFLHAGAKAGYLQDHLRADVCLGVQRRHREVSLFVPGLEGQVGASAEARFPARVPHALFRVDEVVPAVRGLVKSGGVEDEELQLRPPVACVGNAGRLQILLRLASDVSGIAGVVALIWVPNIADQAQGWNGEGGVHRCRGRVGDHQHVAFLDMLEASDRGAVETRSLFEQLLVELPHRYGEVLPGTRQVNELQVYDLDPVGLTPGDKRARVGTLRC